VPPPGSGGVKPSSNGGTARRALAAGADGRRCVGVVTVVVDVIAVSSWVAAGDGEGGGLPAKCSAGGGRGVFRGGGSNATGKTTGSMTVAIIAPTAAGSRSCDDIATGNGVCGSVGCTAMSCGESGGMNFGAIRESIFGGSGRIGPQEPPRFHVQFHPWTAVSIAFGVLPLVVSPHVQVQFHVQLEGAGAAETLVAGAGTAEAVAGAACGVPPGCVCG
jgi:hypothetical protein